MRYRKLDEDGDYILGRRDHFHTEAEAVGQAVYTRLKHLLGEWWENTDEGLPLFQEILGVFRSEEDVADVDLIFSERIEGTKCVLELLEYDSNYHVDTRTYSATCSVNTVFGAVELEIGVHKKERARIGDFVTVKTKLRG